MLIRRALPADAPGIAPLIQQYWQAEHICGFDAPRVSRLLAELLSMPDRGACWIAEGDQVIQGYLLAVFIFSLEHGGLMAEIDEFFVAATQRSGGVGSLLIDTAKRELLAMGVERLQLQLSVGNERGRKFYLRHGFEARAGYALYEAAL